MSARECVLRRGVAAPFTCSTVPAAIDFNGISGGRVCSKRSPVLDGFADFIQQFSSSNPHANI